MVVNFEIENNCALIYEGRHIDIHNNFDFVGYDYEVKSRRLILSWIKSHGKWVKEEELQKLILTHADVYFLNISYDNSSYEYPGDDDCLADISFFPSSERQINSSVTLRAKPDEGDDILYIFQSESFIRIGCGNVELVTIS